jgi:hypothetical protein
MRGEKNDEVKWTNDTDFRCVIVVKRPSVHGEHSVFIALFSFPLTIELLNDITLLIRLVSLTFILCKLNELLSIKEPFDDVLKLGGQ